MNSEIAPLVITIEDVEILKEKLNLILSSLYTNVSIDELFKHELNVEEARVLEDMLLKSGNTPEDKDSLSAVLKELILALDKFSVVKITFGVIPNKSMIETVCQFLRDNVDKNIVVEYKVDTELLGGLKLSFNGLYFDYTLKRKLDTLFKDYYENNTLL